MAIAQLHITGPAQAYPGQDAFIEAVMSGAKMLMADLQRLPTQDEFNMLVAAFARHYSAEHILDPELRTQ